MQQMMLCCAVIQPTQSVNGHWLIWMSCIRALGLIQGYCKQ